MGWEKRGERANHSLLSLGGRETYIGHRRERKRSYSSPGQQKGKEDYDKLTGGGGGREGW